MSANFQIINESLKEINAIVIRDIESEINKLSVYCSKKVNVTDRKGHCYTGFYAYSDLRFNNCIGDAVMVMTLSKVLKSGKCGFYTFSVFNPTTITLAEGENFGKKIDLEYLIVDKLGNEFVIDELPVRGKHFWKSSKNAQISPLGAGTIKKIIGRTLRYEDDPVELPDIFDTKQAADLWAQAIRKYEEN